MVEVAVIVLFYISTFLGRHSKSIDDYLHVVVERSMKLMLVGKSLNNTVSCRAFARSGGGLVIRQRLSIMCLQISTNVPLGPNASALNANVPTLGDRTTVNAPADFFTFRSMTLA